MNQPDSLTQKNPNAGYTFDSERGAPQSELCRSEDGPKGRECVMVSVFTLSGMELKFCVAADVLHAIVQSDAGFYYPLMCLSFC
jgi:hypothetical protein